MCLDLDRPDSQTAPRTERVAHGFGLIPVSSVGTVEDEGKSGGKTENLATNGMTADGMILERHRIAETS